MVNHLVLYAACAAIFFPLDFLWLSVMGQRLYRPELGSLLADSPNFFIAGAFYLVYLAGLVVLVAAPAGGDIGKAFLLGAVLGFVAYGTYDLTNLSTLQGFTPTIAVVDLAWGTALTAVSSAGGVWLARQFGLS